MARNGNEVKVYYEYQRFQKMQSNVNTCYMLLLLLFVLNVLFIGNVILFLLLMLNFFCCSFAILFLHHKISFYLNSELCLLSMPGKFLSCFLFPSVQALQIYLFSCIIHFIFSFLFLYSLLHIQLPKCFISFFCVYVCVCNSAVKQKLRIVKKRVFSPENRRETFQMVAFYLISVCCFWLGLDYIPSVRLYE